MAQVKRKGFTLVELMIVIAIIGILAATLLPTLTGGQARSRDTARKASLQQIASAMETFYQDRGYYPTLTGSNNITDAEAKIDSGATMTGACVAKSNTGATSKWLADNMKGGVTPLDPTPGVAIGMCGIQRVFGYWPMENRGSENSAYALAANVETYQQANSASGTDITIANLVANATTYSGGILNYFTPNPKVPSSTSDTNSIFFIVQG